MGRLADYDITFRPFPIEISHLMHLLKKIFFERPCMGTLQTGEIFCQAPSAFYFGKSYRIKSLGDSISPLGCLSITFPAWRICLKDINNAHFFVLRRGLFQADQRSVKRNGLFADNAFPKAWSTIGLSRSSRAERPERQRIQTLSLCLFSFCTILAT